MKRFITLSILILIVACQKKLTTLVYIENEDKYQITNESFTGESELSEQIFENGQTEGKGKYAYDDEGVLSTLKIGEWTSFYENGQLKSVGKFEIGSYIQCCFSGPCREFYNYKSGAWRYYYPNGQIKAEGDYEVRSLHVITSCKGGDDMKFGLTTSKWRYFNEQGGAIDPTKAMILELETVKAGGNTLESHFYPSEDRQSIEMRFEK